MSINQIKIGVLLPTSLIYPRLGTNFLAGLRIALPEGDGPLLVGETYGASQILAEEKAKKLISVDQVDLLVGLISVNLAAILQPIIELSQTIFLAGNLGENVQRDAERHPLAFQHTLGLWQANWALGQWAAAALGRRAMIAQSFYDSGFDLPFAFRQGFEGAGGEVPFTLVSHIPPDRGNFAPFFAQAAELRPDLIFGSYCGPNAIQFVRAYADSGLAGQIPLLGSGLLTAAPQLAEQGAAALGVRSARAWRDLGADEGGRPLAAAYQARHGAPPDPFALLGIECGLLLAAALAAAANDCRPASLGPALAAVTAQGPRGPLRIDPRGQSSVVEQIYLHEVREQAGQIAPAVIARLDPPAADAPGLAELGQSLRSGWMNTYLSV